MRKNDVDQERPDDAQTSATDLMGRQSVRVTFRLSEACINAISILATHLGIKQKSVFDHLMENTRMLHEVAKQMEDAALGLGNRTQKTFVISRRSLVSLEKISSDFNMPRDALIEFSVQRLLPIIAKEREKHEFRKKLFKKTERHFKEGVSLLKEAEAILGEDDPITRRFESVMGHYQGVFEDLEAFIQKGKRIEGFEPDAFGFTASE
ncbi:MAG: hypothetical protein JRI76_08860 [Deltaproteobacteria bacterium]|nr:hypothetical protein [Deltaproteobacteria bacterium]MBW2042129.1 hypothetical protein [Deltaproteobacteria bacterium]